MSGNSCRNASQRCKEKGAEMVKTECRMQNAGMQECKMQNAGVQNAGIQTAD